MRTSRYRPCHLAGHLLVSPPGQIHSQGPAGPSCRHPGRRTRRAARRGSMTSRFLFVFGRKAMPGGGRCAAGLAVATPRARRSASGPFTTEGSAPVCWYCPWLDLLELHAADVDEWLPTAAERLTSGSHPPLLRRSPRLKAGVLRGRRLAAPPGEIFGCQRFLDHFPLRVAPGLNHVLVLPTSQVRAAASRCRGCRPRARAAGLRRADMSGSVPATVMSAVKGWRTMGRTGSAFHGLRPTDEPVLGTYAAILWPAPAKARGRFQPVGECCRRRAETRRRSSARERGLDGCRPSWWWRRATDAGKDRFTSGKAAWVVSRTPRPGQAARGFSTDCRRARVCLTAHVFASCARFEGLFILITRLFFAELSYTFGEPPSRTACRAAWRPGRLLAELGRPPPG